MTTFHDRVSDYSIDPLFLERWSPRAFTGEPMPRDTLMSIFEAARWAPSSYNSQPWRFIYALHGTPGFECILGVLVPFNQAWAKNASVLVIAASKKTVKQQDRDITSHTHSFDTGAAWQNISLQALKLGWHTHGMSGVDFPRAAAELNVPDECRVEMAFVIGKLADKAILPQEMQAREIPNGRSPVSSFVFEGSFPSEA